MKFLTNPDMAPESAKVPGNQHLLRKSAFKKKLGYMYSKKYKIHEIYAKCNFPPILPYNTVISSHLSEDDVCQKNHFLVWRKRNQ